MVCSILLRGVWRDSSCDLCGRRAGDPRTLVVSCAVYGEIHHVIDLTSVMGGPGTPSFFGSMYGEIHHVIQATIGESVRKTRGGP